MTDSTNIDEIVTKVPEGTDISSFGTDEKRTWEAQDRFLRVFARTRTKTKSSEAAGVHRDTARRWESDNVLGFQARLAVANEVFTDGLEQKALDLVRDLTPTNSPLLLITLLNRHLPEVYRPGVVVPDDRAKEVLEFLRNPKRGHPKDASGAVEEAHEIIRVGRTD